MTYRTVRVPVLARVEGQGGLHVRIEGGEVADVRLDIFEAPRFFEALLVGRHFDDVLDITARVCGICPVAYQMTAAHAFEDHFGTAVPDGIAPLRRLLYCGEWIQSHMLHVHLLAAPDFLGLPDAFALVATDRTALDRGLRLRALGTRIMALIGGRSVHPVSPRVGGFSRVPSRSELSGLQPALDQAADDILGAADWVAGFDAPALARPARFVALAHPHEYSMNEGEITSTAGEGTRAEGFEDWTEQLEVPYSSARHAQVRALGPVVMGPLARLNLNPGRLNPLARAAARRLSLSLPEPDPFRSLAARIVETAHVIEEAQRLVATYEPPDRAWAPSSPRPGRAVWATEAPRGILYHRYDVDASGVVKAACLIPPTMHNLPAMEADVRLVAAGAIDRSDRELTRLCEMAVRNHDPCISCATHLVRSERD